MGAFPTSTVVGRDKEALFEPVTALVDTGAVYSMLPANLLYELEVVPWRGERSIRRRSYWDGEHRPLQEGP